MDCCEQINSLVLDETKVQRHQSIWGGSERIRQLEMIVLIQSQQLIEAQERLVSMAEMFEEYLRKEKHE